MSTLFGNAFAFSAVFSLNNNSTLILKDLAIKSNDYTVYYSNVKSMSYQIFYIIGASIAGLALLGAL